MSDAPSPWRDAEFEVSESEKDFLRPTEPPAEVQRLFDDAVMHATGSAVLVNRMSLSRIDEDQYILAVGTLLGFYDDSTQKMRDYAKVHGAYLLGRTEMQILANRLKGQFGIEAQVGLGKDEAEVVG